MPIVNPSTFAPADNTLLGLLAASSGSSLVGFIQSGTGAVAETEQAALRRFVFVTQWGALGDGVTDDITAITNAYNATPIGGKLIFPAAPNGYLISSKFTVAKNIEIEFWGKRAVANNDFPGSYLLKKSTMTTSGMDITTNGVVVHGGGVVGAIGNTGDGIAILANNVILDQPCGINCGQDGIRVGSDVGVNANTCLINKPVCSGNGRNGLYIHDGSTNANAGTVILPFCQSNAVDGIKLGTAVYTTIVGTLVENNTGWGVHLASGATRNSFYGGDTNESNTSGNIITDAGANSNNFIGIDYVTGSRIDNGTGNLWLSDREVVFPVYISSGSTSALGLGTSSGVQFKVADKANAVNFLQVEGGGTGVSAKMYAVGETDVTAGFSSKGVGTLLFFTNTFNQAQFEITHTANSTRRVTATGSNGGNPAIGTSAGNLGFTSALVGASNLRLSHGTSALATNATEGFFHVQSCAGPPSGTPATIPTGQIPLVWDSTNLQLYAYTGGAWKKSAVFT